MGNNYSLNDKHWKTIFRRAFWGCLNFADVRIVVKQWLAGVYGPEAILKRRYIPPALILARRILICKWPTGGWRASFAIPNLEVMKRNSSTVKVSFWSIYLFSLPCICFPSLNFPCIKFITRRTAHHYFFSFKYSKRSPHFIHIFMLFLFLFLSPTF